MYDSFLRKYPGCFKTYWTMMAFHHGVRTKKTAPLSRGAVFQKHSNTAAVKFLRLHLIPSHPPAY